MYNVVVCVCVCVYMYLPRGTVLTPTCLCASLFTLSVHSLCYSHTTWFDPPFNEPVHRWHPPANGSAPFCPRVIKLIRYSLFGIRFPSILKPHMHTLHIHTLHMHTLHTTLTSRSPATRKLFTLRKPQTPAALPQRHSSYQYPHFKQLNHQVMESCAFDSAGETD